MKGLKITSEWLINYIKERGNIINIDLRLTVVG